MLQILLRLCWKECRRGWPLLALGLLLPPLAVGLRLSRHYVMPLGLNSVEVMVYTLLVGVVLWASTLVAGGNTRTSFAAVHFPLHPGWPMLSMLCCQGCNVLLIGANVGWWTARLHRALPMPANVLLAAVYFLAAFLLTLAVARAISLPAAIVAGVLWVITPIGGLMACQQLRAPFDWQGRVPDDLWQNALLCAPAALLAFLLLLSGRRGLLPRRVLAVVLLAGATIGFFCCQLWKMEYGRGYYDSQDRNDTLNLSASSAEGSLLVMPAPVPDNAPLGPTVALQFIDYRSQQRVVRDFPLPVKVLAINGRAAALLLAPGAGGRRLTLSRWEFADNSLHPLITFPACRGTFRDVLRQFMYNPIASCSPDGRYALLYLPSLQCHELYQDDIWLVDLAARQARLVIANMSMVAPMPQVSWAGGQAILQQGEGIYQAVSLTDGAVALWAGQAALEGRR